MECALIKSFMPDTANFDVAAAVGGNGGGGGTRGARGTLTEGVEADTGRGGGAAEGGG
jgi:hypothetical protein